MTDKTTLGDRMKSYEEVPRIFLTPRMPTIIRVDGRAFHTFTRGFEKPWDHRIVEAMTAAASALISDIQGAKIAYIQSDEISILLNDYEKFNTMSWFDKNVQKMASVSASIATAAFNKSINIDKIATFDSRCFILGREEVNNYFLWRQQDAIRNSIAGLAQKYFSAKQLHKKNSITMIEMLSEKGILWENLPVYHQRGWCVTKHTKPYGDSFRTVTEPDYEIPMFKEDKAYISKHLTQIEE